MCNRVKMGDSLRRTSIALPPLATKIPQILPLWSPRVDCPELECTTHQSGFASILWWPIHKYTMTPIYDWKHKYIYQQAWLPGATMYCPSELPHWVCWWPMHKHTHTQIVIPRDENTKIWSSSVHRSFGDQPSVPFPSPRLVSIAMAIDSSPHWFSSF